MQTQESIQPEHDSSQPIIIPGQDVSQHSSGSFVPESYQTAQSLKQSPGEFPFSSSANSTHSQVLNNSYGHQFVNNFNNLRNPFNASSPTSNFSPRAEPPSFQHQRHSITESSNTAFFQTTTPRQPMSYSRPSLLTSKLASSSSTTTSSSQSNQLPSLQQPANDSHKRSSSFLQQNTHTATPPRYSGSASNDQPFQNQSSSINIEPPATSQHFNVSGIVNSYTPNHNTPSVVSSSYSSAPNSVPTYVVNSSSFPSIPHFSRTQPTTNVITETARPVDFSKHSYPSHRSSGTPGATQRESPQEPQSTTGPSQQPDHNMLTPEPQEQHDDHLISSTIADDSSNEFHLDIVNHPVDDLLLMLSALLQKIIEANDSLHPHHYHHASQLHDSNKFTANVLAFHGRNVPAISIHAYLSRILKYCPVTNEVFLTLLVYFDRVAKRANAGDNEEGGAQTGEEQLFVMDSYNIHRLIIAGITVASKFFSDIFYKNSRYAKVGGLPLEELNHLELQFLLLTDFRLLIQIEELQRYADLLLKFWRREQAKPSEQQQSQSQTSEGQEQDHQQ